MHGLHCMDPMTRAGRSAHERPSDIISRPARSGGVRPLAESWPRDQPDGICANDDGFDDLAGGIQWDRGREGGTVSAPNFAVAPGEAIPPSNVQGTMQGTVRSVLCTSGDARSAGGQWTTAPALTRRRYNALLTVTPGPDATAPDQRAACP